MIAEDKLIFLSCLPRSGSTLLQRIFAECDLVFTESESWVMLPLLDLRLDHTLETVYGKNSASQAIGEFYDGIQPDRIDRLYRDFALGLYAEKMPQSAEFFLDKTPRYYLISDNLEKVFPSAKHIYLTRNPIAVLVSIYTSWVSNDLNALVNYQVDLVEGVRRLAKTVSSTRSLVCSYEHLLESPQEVFSSIAAYAGLEDMSRGSLTYRRAAAGSFGDDQSLIKSGQLNFANSNKWHDQLKDPILFELASTYLDSLDAEIFEDLGYVRAETKAILEEARLKHSHLTDPSLIKISGFSLPQFFSGKRSSSSSLTWYALRKRNEAQKQQLSALEHARRKAQKAQKEELRDCQRALDSAASELEELEFEAAVAKETIRIYQGLANSSWVKLGNALNEPVKATRRLLTKFK